MALTLGKNVAVARRAARPAVSPPNPPPPLLSLLEARRSPSLKRALGRQFARGRCARVDRIEPEVLAWRAEALAAASGAADERGKGSLSPVGGGGVFLRRTPRPASSRMARARAGRYARPARSRTTAQEHGRALASHGGKARRPRRPKTRPIDRPNEPLPSLPPPPPPPYHTLAQASSRRGAVRVFARGQKLEYIWNDGQEGSDEKVRAPFFFCGCVS